MVSGREIFRGAKGPGRVILSLRVTRLIPVHSAKYDLSLFQYLIRHLVPLRVCSILLATDASTSTNSIEIMLSRLSQMI